MCALRRPVLVGVLTGLMTMLAGCSGLNRPYPAKRCFALEVPERPERISQPVNSTVRVRQFRVSPPYHQQQFVYKLGDTEFKRDYYDEFIASPAELVTDQTVAWLYDSGVFHTTCCGGSAADHDLVLEAVVTSLYGDYTEHSAPAAVLAIHFFLLSDESAHTNVVFDRTYTERVPLAGDGPDMLVRGWSQGLQHILTGLDSDLGAAATASVGRRTQGLPEWNLVRQE